MAFAGELEEHDDCPDCAAPLTPRLRVLHSPAGFYIGQQCNRCGPVNRLSDYMVKTDAEAELRVWNVDGVRPHARTPGYWGEG